MPLTGESSWFRSSAADNGDMLLSSGSPGICSSRHINSVILIGFKQFTLVHEKGVDYEDTEGKHDGFNRSI